MNIVLITTYEPGCTASLLKRGFEQAGHNVEAFTPMTDVPHDWKTLQGNDAIEIIQKCSSPPDFAIFTEPNGVTRFFPQNITLLHIPTALWAVDNHLNFRWNKEYARQFDVVFFAQRDYVEPAQRYGVENVYWLPLGADPEYHAGTVTAQKIYDIAFVGKLNTKRRKFLASIAEKFRVAAKTGIYNRAMGDVYQSAKIGVNICENKDLNMRFFEVLASGAMLVTEKIDAGMSELFIENEDYVTHAIADIIPILETYLTDDAARLSIAATGQKKCLERHLYKHRAETMISYINDLGEYHGHRTSGWQLAISMALVYNHRNFHYGWKKTIAHAMRLNFHYLDLKRLAARHFFSALFDNPLGTIQYCTRYFRWSIREHYFTSKFFG